MPIPAIVWYIVISVVSSVLAALINKPKIEGAKAQTGEIPEVDEGKVVYKIYGTVWVDDSQVLAWRQLPPEPIQQKAGKK